MKPKKLNFYQAAERYEIAVSTLYSWLSKGWFPKPKRLGKRVFWFQEDLDRWDAEGYPRPCDQNNEVMQ